ncbi:MAG: PilZ domain-containing protein [Spirochaetaceae bacterium]
METVILYARAISPEIVKAAAPQREVVVAETTARLVEHVVHRKNVVSVVVELNGAIDEDGRLLRSFVRLFPTIVVAVVTDPAELPFPLPKGAVLVPIEQSEEQILNSLREAIVPRAQPDRRQFNRFDWPLQATLGPAPSQHATHRIRALSAGGAFLERSGRNPDPGSVEEITIRFGNFSLSTQCEILNPRQASSTLPDGFGIRFVRLSPKAEEIIERIVNDALVQVLLGDDEQPEIPSLDEDVFTFSLGEEISLN